MSTKLVYIELEETWQWYISDENGFTLSRLDDKPKTIEVNEEWLEDLKRASAEYSKKRAVLEHLYRKQNGLSPYTMSEDEVEEMKKAVPNFNEEK